jgi:hypothetical protein
MTDVVLTRSLPRRDRLEAVLNFLHDRMAANFELATFMAIQRRTGGTVVHCPLGYYVASGIKDLALVPVNFRTQVKDPSRLAFLMERYPLSQWRHHTLCWRTRDGEAWGLTAACVHFQMPAALVQRLFWPAPDAASSQSTSAQVALRISHYLESHRRTEQ